MLDFTNKTTPRMTIPKTSSIILIIIFILINISSMACEMCEMCEIFPKLRGSIQLELTEDLTDPNSNSHNSQNKVILDGPLLLMVDNSQLM